MKTAGKLILGFLLGLVLSATSVIGINQVSTTSEKPRYYENCYFDFIIPKPWYTQISEIKNMPIIDDITPYYVTGRTVDSNGKNINADIFLLENNSNVDITAFGQTLLLSGNSSIKSDEIILDENLAHNLSVKEGDVVVISFGGNKINYTVKGITQENRFSTRPTAAILFTGIVKKEIESAVEQLSYSAAFIKANNISEAESYFNSKYAALGKVGERSWYKDEESYFYMKESIQKTSVAKEITNIAQLKANSTSEFKEDTNRGVKHLIIIVFLIFIINILIWLINLGISAKQYRNDIRLGEKVNTVIKKFFAGQILSVIIFTAIIFLFRKNFSDLQFVSLIIAEVISVVIILLITSRNINRAKDAVKEKVTR